jgi:hypothetical protein
VLLLLRLACGTAFITFIYLHHLLFSVFFLCSSTSFLIYLLRYVVLTSHAATISLDAAYRVALGRARSACFKQNGSVGVETSLLNFSQIGRVGRLIIIELFGT